MKKLISYLLFEKVKSLRVLRNTLNMIDLFRFEEKSSRDKNDVKNEVPTQHVIPDSPSQLAHVHLTENEN